MLKEIYRFLWIVNIFALCFEFDFLHMDDVAILYRIKEFLGVGKVFIEKDSALFVITNAGDLINVRASRPILDQYKLLTTKYLDYLDFVKVVNKLITNKSSVFTGENG